MTFEAVISCPRCLRQYAVDSSLDGKEGQCASCKSRFVVSVPMLASGGDDPIVFDSEIASGFSFIREACAVLAMNTCDLIRMAGEPFSVESVVSVVKSLPHAWIDLTSQHWLQGRCSQMMKEAFALSEQTEDKARYDELFEYFTHRQINRTFLAQDSLEGAFIGVLGSMTWPEEREPIPSPAPAPERARGPLERWAARMGW